MFSDRESILSCLCYSESLAYWSKNTAIAFPAPAGMLVFILNREVTYFAMDDMFGGVPSLVTPYVHVACWRNRWNVRAPKTEVKPFGI